jgi:arylsulfatase A-like enzyme
MAPQGNVLYITLDQWRGDCLSSAGHPLVRTPTLDRLAAKGVRFANHWANIAPCGPSRCTMHTGMYAQNHRAVLNGSPLDDRFTNTARQARVAGYEPALFGYTDTGIDPRTVADPDDPRLRTYEGVLPGFDTVVVNPESRDAWGRWLAAKGVDVPSHPIELYEPLDGYPGIGDHGESWAPTRFSAEHSETAFLIDEMQQWFSQRGDDPFFVHASFLRPHPPYRNPVGYHDAYSADDVPDFRRHATREEEMATHVLPGMAINIPGVGCPVQERDARQQRATYYAAMAEVDDQLEQWFAWLGEQGLLDDTLVVITSDHGEQAGDHYLLEKLGYWDESYHVPLIVIDPRATADGTRGTVVDAVTEHVDLLPTLCEWMGVEVPLQCDGRPLQPFLSGQGAPDDWRTEAHWEWDFRNPELHLAEDLLGLRMEECCLNVVRTPTHKYVHFAGVDQTVAPPLLFDLEADPDQLTNVAGDPAYDGVRADLLGKLLSWRMRHDERTLTGYFLSESGLVHRVDERRG